MQIDVIRILASGSYKSFMLINVPVYGLQWVYIPRELYVCLKDNGVETAQKHRNENGDDKRYGQ